MSAHQTQLTDEGIVEVLSLLKNTDSVELKVTVSDADRHSAVLELDLDVLDCDLRQVVFFDTPDLQLSRAGVIVRARRTRKGGDSVVKLRPVVPAELPRRLRRADGFRIELDAMPGRFVCSGSLKERVDNADIKEVLLGKRLIHKLFSNEQRAFYAEHAPKGLELAALTPFGPIKSRKNQIPARQGKLTASRWRSCGSTRMGRASWSSR